MPRPVTSNTGEGGGPVQPPRAASSMIILLTCYRRAVSRKFRSVVGEPAWAKLDRGDDYRISYIDFPQMEEITKPSGSKSIKYARPNVQN